MRVKAKENGSKIKWSKTMLFLKLKQKFPNISEFVHFCNFKGLKNGKLYSGNAKTISTNTLQLLVLWFY